MTKRILFLAANPLATDRLRIDEEIRDITECLERAQNRSGFEIVQKWAVRFKDFRKALLETKPHIVHFSGHGEEEAGIILEDNDGNPKPISEKVLSDLLANIDCVECVVLNACYTDDHVTEIAKHIDYVISKRDPFLDPAAIVFSVSYYEAIFAGLSYSKAFLIGCNSLQHEFPNELPPSLMGRKVQSPIQEMDQSAQIKTNSVNTIINENNKKNKSEESTQANSPYNAYVHRLKKTRTYLSGIIEDIEEYKFRVHFGGVLRTLPPLPQANRDRHIVVLELIGNQPSNITILTKPNHTFLVSTREVDKWVFIFFSARPHRITVADPQEGYLLGDGQRIFAEIELVFCMTDLEMFWSSDRDPIANLESNIVNTTRDYFSKLNSVSFISTPDVLENKLEGTIIDSQLSIIRDGLKAKVRSTVFSGIRIDQVNIHIRFTEQLQAFIDYLHENVFNIKQTDDYTRAESD